MSKRLFIIIVFLISYPLAAQFFAIKHPDCRLRVKNFTDKNDFLKDTFLKKIKERDFKLDYLVDDKRLIVGEMYLNMIISKPKKVIRKQKIDGKMVNKTIKPLYSPCVVKLELRKAKGSTTSASDKILFSKEVERGFPRVTFKGNERCTRALKDAFVHIPKCTRN